MLENKGCLRDRSALRPSHRPRSRRAAASAARTCIATARVRCCCRRACRPPWDRSRPLQCGSALQVCLRAAWSADAHADPVDRLQLATRLLAGQVRGAGLRWSPPRRWPCSGSHRTRRQSCIGDRLRSESSRRTWHRRSRHRPIPAPANNGFINQQPRYPLAHRRQHGGGVVLPERVHLACASAEHAHRAKHSVASAMPRSPWLTRSRLNERLPARN